MERDACSGDSCVELSSQPVGKMNAIRRLVTRTVRLGPVQYFSLIRRPRPVMRTHPLQAATLGCNQATSRRNSASNHSRAIKYLSVSWGGQGRVVLPPYPSTHKIRWLHIAVQRTQTFRSYLFEFSLTATCSRPQCQVSLCDVARALAELTLLTIIPGMKTQQRQQEILKLRRRTRVLQALVRLLLLTVRLSGFRLDRERLPDGLDKGRVLIAIKLARHALLSWILKSYASRLQRNPLSAVATHWPS